MTNEIFKYGLIKSDPYITTEQLINKTGLSESAVYKVVRALRESGKIRRIGGDNGGCLRCHEL